MESNMNAPAPTPTILIIDNDEGMVATLTTRLEHAGYECLTAVSGSQGLGILNEATIDLIITDLIMPNGDGISLIKTVRGRGNIPIIVITGFSEEIRDALPDLPHVTRMQKPFDAEALLDLVEMELAMAQNHESAAGHRVSASAPTGAGSPAV
jgi:DNA-binding NtrC family response regulator